MAPNIHVALRDQSQITLLQVQHLSHANDPQNDETNIVLEQVSPFNIDHLQQLLTSKKWDAAITLINLYRNDIANHVMKVVCQGETYEVPAMHFAVGTIADCPIPVLEALIDAHPTALLTPDSRRGLTPVHLGLIKGTIGLTQINFLLSVCPELALKADVDGNLPLHLAVEYASDEMIQRVLAACPAAAGYQTKRQRYALHLFATSHYQIVEPSGNVTSDDFLISVHTLKAIVDAYPYALQQPDLQGRLPLHLAACTPFPRWDVVKCLCDAYPDALLIQDESHKVPLQLLKRFTASSSFSTSDSQMTNPDNDIILTFLHDRTIAEKRKKNAFHKLLSKVVPFKKRAQMPSSSYPAVTTDLMNCYG